MAARYQTRTDAELFALLRGGDRDAYAEIFERFWPLLHRFTWRMLADRDDATDVVQDVFVVLWERRETLDASGSLKTFLYTVAKNRVLRFIRQSKVAAQYLAHQQHVIVDDAPAADAQLFERELAARIEAELDALPPKAREAFLLSRMEDRSYREIAEQMQISDSTVKQHISKALRILRDKLTVLLFL